MTDFDDEIFKKFKKNQLFVPKMAATLKQGPFCACVQPMRDDFTM